MVIEPLESEPILFIQWPVLQLGDLLRSRIVLRKMRGLLRHHRCILGKYIHDEPPQLLQILLVGRILDLPLIVNIGQKIAILKIAVQILWVPKILRGYQPTLYEMRPGVALQVAVPGLADPVVAAAFLELADAIVLAAEGNEAVHRGFVAALDVGS